METKELMDIVNENGEYIKTQDRNGFLKENEYIQMVHIYLLRRNNEIYIQQRSESKQENPNLWEVVGGGVAAGENVFTAAIRELREETGILLDENAFTKIGNLTCPKYYINCFIAYFDGNDKFSPQFEEVKNTMFVTFDEVLNLINDDRFFSTSFGIFQKYYKENLE